jgi:hypothetical protein
VTIRLLAAVALLAGCSRRADLRDEPDGGVDLQPALDAGDVPAIDGALDGAPPCAMRPQGPCEGPVDFPCAFSDWVIQTADGCQQATGCVTNGWLEVTMDDAGCVVAIGMTEPNDAIVGCLAAELGASSCPCMSGVVQHFFGVANMGSCGEP